MKYDLVSSFITSIRKFLPIARRLIALFKNMFYSVESYGLKGRPTTIKILLAVEKVFLPIMFG